MKQVNDNDLFVSSLQLDRRAIKALRIKDPYSIHRVVYSLFDDIRDEEEKRQGRHSGILYADEGGDFRGRKIIILSNRQPLSRIPEGYGMVQTKRIPEGFLDYDIYRFKTTINPARRQNATGKIVPVRGLREIMEWFSEKAASSWGFGVYSKKLEIDNLTVLSFRGKAGHPITISTATLKGVLKVESREHFRESFMYGIGRARAFGCGLLQIVPIR